MKQDDDYEAYLKLIPSLRNVQPANWDRQHKLAFFLNVYNSLIVHATIESGHPKNDPDREKFFNRMRYKIGEHEYSLNDIENGILWGNKPGSGQNKNVPFAENDPRQKVMLSPGDARIHFALNCGAKSCPPIRAYSPEKVDDQLSLATRGFLEDDENVFINTETRTLGITKLFLWYRTDFGSSDHEVASFVLKHLPDGMKKKALEELISDSFTVTYLDYDWTPNRAILF